MSQKYSPIYKQYVRLKEKYKDAILLFRLGDFYEMFMEDAHTVSKVLQLTLTSKPMGKNLRVPMCGIPVKSANTYIKKLLEKGFKVAIAEQMDEFESKRLMKREVVEVLTPGTIVDEDFLKESENNYIASIYKEFGRMGLALMDVSTGEFSLYEGNSKEIVEFLNRIGIKELLLPEGTKLNLSYNVHTVEFPSKEFNLVYARETIKDVLGKPIESFLGLRFPKLAIRSAGVLLKYISTNKKGALKHIGRIVFKNIRDYMYLDKQTIRNLELVESIRGDASGRTLLNTLDRCRTPMGRRALRKAILNPFANLKFIEKRLDRIQALMELKERSKQIASILELVGDPERKLGKISLNRITPIEMFKFAYALKNIVEIARILKDYKPFESFFNDAKRIEELSENILSTLSDDPPYRISDGNVIRRGVSKELDRLRDVLENNRKLLEKLEREEKLRTNIPTLKVGYNSVYGYYIEITKTHKHKVPPDWEGIQTLVNTIRFKTPKLIALEKEITYAKQRIEAIEREIFSKMKANVLESIHILRRAFEEIAEVDLCLSISQIAKERKYTKPNFVEKDIVEIREGRHPVVESYTSNFVPNDLVLDERKRMIVLTGPNMSGKSTYLRQNALIVLMAHMGFFVPASKVELGMVDRVFSRIGASDDIASGVSTFMAEMIETATILNNATRRSFVILDEVGRGTSTYDGMAIARAVVEYIAQYINCKTLFATHYHELSDIERELPNVVSYTMEVEEYEDDIVFTRRVKKGRSDRSYGLYVAKLSGLPSWVIERAKEIMAEISLQKGAMYNIDPDELTPKQALEILYKLKGKS